MGFAPYFQIGEMHYLSHKTSRKVIQHGYVRLFTLYYSLSTINHHLTYIPTSSAIPPSASISLSPSRAIAGTPVFPETLQCLFVQARRFLSMPCLLCR